MNTKSFFRSKVIIPALTILLLLVFFLCFPIKGFADNGDTIVHITKTGECYHSAHCSYLKSDIEITLYEAHKAGYRPCSRCNPPIYDGGNEEYSEPEVNTYVENIVETPITDVTSVHHNSTPSSIETESAQYDDLNEIIINAGSSSASTSSAKPAPFIGSSSAAGTVPSSTDSASSASSAATTTLKNSTYSPNSSSDNSNRINANAKEATKADDSEGSIFSLIILGTVGVIGYKVYKNKKEEQKNNNKRANQSQYESERQRYYEIYARKNPLDLVNVPDGVFLKDDLPCTNSSNGSLYGDYTVYVGEKSFNTFHFNPNCGGATLRPVNYYSAHLLQHCSKCATGRIKLPQLEWYMKYLEIKQIKEKYNIP